MAFMLSSTETRQTIIIGSKKTTVRAPHKTRGMPAEPESIQNQLFKQKEWDHGQTRARQATVYPAVSL